MIQALLPFPHIDPVLISLGPFAIRWYALAYIAGIVLAWWGIARVLRQKALWAHPPFNGRPPATEEDRKSTRLNSSHYSRSRMPSCA